ncbi:uncharacterized protein A4U43_C01F13330 [Asparagus officinalis]|uniref:Membrane-associated kinase regulator 2 n=1 Tax=Asparagus officinalis TaxID=4686 RepID=A0A5P1FPV0_ASPOF|nr:uncharacterized protein A4U43_C01F13330 [Asparagus officinalis]
METFSLLRYWKSNRDCSSTNFATSALRSSTDSSSSSSDDDDDDGSFFDLDFSVEYTADGQDENAVENLDDTSSESGEEAASPTSSSELSVSLSPSDHLFFNGDLIPLEDSDPKSSQFSVSLLKSATRFRVFMLRLRKPKSAQNQNKNTKSFVNFKVEEVPIVSLFRNPLKTRRSDDDLVEDKVKLSKETVQKYINKIRPRNGLETE